MKTIRRIIAGLCLALPIAAAPGAAFAQRRGAAKDDKAAQVQEELGVAVGETKTIPASGVKQYSEGTPGVVDVRLTPDGSKFILVGQKQGSTSLLLIKNDGSQVNWVINVFSRSPELVEHELNQLLEGYPGLIVHGPLIATLLVDLLRRERPQARLKRFAFTALRPSFDIHRFQVCGRDDGSSTFALWGRDHEGFLTMRAEARTE